MFDTECLHTPYLPPAATTSSLRAPAAPNHVPEADLLNLNPTDPSGPRPPTSPRRRTGFSKMPGGKRGSPAEEEPVKDNVDDDEEFEEEEWVPDVFLFEYGTVVIWGMTEKEEKTFLKNLRVRPVLRVSCQLMCVFFRKKFEVERLSAEDVEMEDLNFYYADYSRYVASRRSSRTWLCDNTDCSAR